jgi:hypothetical protein
VPFSFEGATVVISNPTSFREYKDSVTTDCLHGVSRSWNLATVWIENFSPLTAAFTYVHESSELTRTNVYIIYIYIYIYTHTHTHTHTQYFWLYWYIAPSIRFLSECLCYSLSKWIRFESFCGLLWLRLLTCCLFVPYWNLKAPLDYGLGIDFSEIAFYKLRSSRRSITCGWL